MNVLADISIVPLGVGVSVSKYVAACQKIFAKKGLNTTLHAYGTNVEGSWEEVMEALRQCHDVLHEMGAPRVSSTVKITTRTDRVQTLADKIKSVEEKIT